MYFGLKEEKQIRKLSTAKDSDIDTYCKKNKLSKKEHKVLKTIVGLTNKIDPKYLASDGSFESLPAVKLTKEEMEVLKAGLDKGAAYRHAMNEIVDGLAYANGFIMGFIFGGR
jgi:uncharacterized UBP type Zn finger protein